jgi:hypothetical protein
MPSQLLLVRTCRQLYELNSERLKPHGIRHGEFFHRIGGTHADQLIRMVHAVYQDVKQCWPSAYDLHHVIYAADGSPITTLQRTYDGLMVHSLDLEIRRFGHQSTSARPAGAKIRIDLLRDTPIMRCSHAVCTDKLRGRQARSMKAYSGPTYCSHLLGYRAAERFPLHPISGHPFESGLLRNGMLRIVHPGQHVAMVFLSPA